MNYKYQNFLTEHNLEEYEGTFERLFNLLSRVYIQKDSFAYSYINTNDPENQVEVTDNYDILIIQNKKVILKYYPDDQYNIRIEFWSIVDNRPRRILFTAYLEDKESYSLKQEGTIKRFPLHPLYIIYLIQRLTSA